VGVPVTVVDPGADHRHPWADRTEERRVGRRRAVVRDREEVDLQQAGTAGAGRQLEQVPLGGGLDVAGHQHPQPVPGREDHERAVVQLARRPPVGTAAIRGEHLEVQVADDRDVPRRRRPHGHLPGGSHRHELGRLGEVGRDRPVPDRPDGDRPHHVRGPADVVEVPVGHHQQVEVPAPVRAQPPRRGPVLARVDEDPRAGRLDQERIALTHVDGGDGQGPHRETSGHERCAGDHEGRRGRHRQGRPHAAPLARADEPAGTGGQGDDRRGPSRRRRPPHVGEGVGGPQHRTGGDARRQEQPAREVRGRDGDHRGDHGAGDRERRRGHGQHVRGHGCQGDLTEGGQQQRDDRELRADGDREDLGEPPREPVEALADDRREQEHPSRRARRQEQPERAGEEGIHQQEEQHGARQPVPGVARHPAGACEQDHQPHGAGAEDGRLEPGEEREGHEHDDQHASLRAGADAHHGAGRHHAADQDGDVGAGDGRQVGEAARSHRLGVVLRQQPGVAGDEPGQQPAQPVRLPGGRGRPDPLADVLARAGQPPRPADRVPPGAVEDHRRVLPGQPPSVATLRQGARGRVAAPALSQGGRVVVHGHRRPLAGRDAVHLLDPDEDVPPPGGRARFVDHDGAHRPRPTGRGECREEAAVARDGPAADRGQGDGRDREEPEGARRRGARCRPGRPWVGRAGLAAPGREQQADRAERRDAGGRAEP
jgi:hypothetical protein